jgi:ParB family chromosome partitioning protein
LQNAYFLARKIIDKSLSVRQTELLVRIFKNKKITKHTSKDPNLKKLETTIINKTGLNVSIKNKKNNTGSISFEYKNLEQLNRILELIKSNY